MLLTIILACKLPRCMALVARVPAPVPLCAVHAVRYSQELRCELATERMLCQVGHEALCLGGLGVLDMGSARLMVMLITICLYMHVYTS